MAKRKFLFMVTRQEMEEHLKAADDRTLIKSENQEAYIRSIFCENLGPFQYVVSDGTRCVVCTIIEG